MMVMAMSVNVMLIRFTAFFIASLVLPFKLHRRVANTVLPQLFLYSTFNRRRIRIGNYVQSCIRIHPVNGPHVDVMYVNYAADFFNMLTQLGHAYVIRRFLKKHIESCLEIFN